MAIPLGDGYGSVGPVSQSVLVTTNATSTPATLTRAVYVSTNGDLTVLLAFDTVSTTFSSVVGGSWLPIRVKTFYSAPAGTLALW
jgi:hypothetical protein